MSRRFNIANVISLFRALTAIPIVYCIDQGSPWVFIWIAVAVFSDWLDGFLARRYEMITPLGSILDPIADFIVIAAVMTWFYLNHWVSGWLWWLMLARYSCIFLAVMLFLQADKDNLKSNFSGKCSVCVASVYGLAVLCDATPIIITTLEVLLAFLLMLSWWNYYTQYLRPKCLHRQWLSKTH